MGQVTSHIILAFGAALVGLLIGGCSSGSYSVAVPDVSKNWERQFAGFWPTVLGTGSLAIRIRGELDGEASVTIAGTEYIVMPGIVDKIVSRLEYWGDSCIIAYRPRSSSLGRLTFDVVVGGRSPTWVLKPPAGTEPLGYTGGWTTWHPGSDTKYSKGSYYHGKKHGEFIYWDKQGGLLGTETWTNGRKTEKEDAKTFHTNGDSAGAHSP